MFFCSFAGLTETEMYSIEPTDVFNAVFAIDRDVISVVFDAGLSSRLPKKLHDGKPTTRASRDSNAPASLFFNLMMYSASGHSGVNDLM